MSKTVDAMLRRAARANGRPIKELKKEWNSTPRNERAALRVKLESVPGAVSDVVKEELDKL